MNTCVNIPTVKINGVEKPSKLFQDLTSMFKNRNDAIEVWCLFQVPGFGEQHNLKKINGEYLAEDIKTALNFDTVLENKLSKAAIKKTAGFILEDGTAKIYKRYDDAVSDAKEFNNSHSFNNAIVSKAKGGFLIDLQDRATSEQANKDQIFNDELNKRLHIILNQLGFDVSILDNPEYSGVFDPTNSKETADGLIDVIKIAKGELGEKAFKEEFAHLIIAGLRNKPLVRRALESLTEEELKNILGEQYDEYKEKYDNEQLLREECLGRMLSQSLQNNFKNDNLGFLNRLWNFIKSIFVNGDVNSINNAKSEAWQIAEDIAKTVLSDKIDKLDIDKEDVLSSKQLYHLEETKSKIAELAEEAQKVYYLLAKERSTRNTSGLYSDRDIDVMKSLDKQINSKQYVQSCSTFLTGVLDEIKEAYANIQKLGEKNLQETPSAIRTLSLLIANLRNNAEAYEDVIKELKALRKNYEEFGISKEDGESISSSAREVDNLLDDVFDDIKGLTTTVATEFLKPYWKDKQIDSTFIKNQVVTLDTILNEGFNDISFADNLVNALSESSDILLSLMAKISIHQQDLRDDRLIEDDRYIREQEEKLRASGSDSSFMFDKDENGKPTGWLISDRNSVAYEKAKKAYIEELKLKEDLSARERITMLQQWEKNNQTEITRTFNGVKFTSRVPNDKYKYPEGGSPLDKLTIAQREYYDAMMSLKAARESALPEYKQNLYRAVQIRNDFVETLAKDITDPKKLYKTCIEKIKDKFIRRIDDTEFGQLAMDGEQMVLLNVKGDAVVKQIPVFYISPLEDMSQLSMDFGGAIRAFTASLTNFEMMNQILPQMLLLNNIIQNRKVTMRVGNNTLNSVKRVFGKEIKQTYKKKGKELKIGKAADFLIDKFYYGINKADEGTIGRTNIDTAKVLDFVKEYTSLMGMGLNMFSGISNLTMGGMQMFLEAVGKENFDFKDLSKAHLLYDKDIIGCIAEIGSIKRENKLSLLMDKFDSLESFYDELKRKMFYKTGAARTAKEMSFMIFNEMGEHRLHNVTMLAMLNHEKVKLGNSEISLYDALEVSKEEVDEKGNKVPTAAYLKIKDGVTKLDGSEFTQEDFIALKRKISRANRRMHGAYSEAYKGQINQKGALRLVMQFRQWMPAFYSNRFAGIFSGSYYDVELGDVEEGYYVTALKFITKTLKDVKNMKFEILTNLHNMTPHQKANMRKAVAETASCIILGVLAFFLGGIDDKESTWTKKMLKYQLLRLNLEVGAAVPFNPSFFDNIWTMMQSPAAAVKTCKDLTDLLKFWNLCIEIQTGRYQGYSRYHKDVLELLPLYGQIRKAWDLKEETYMFNLFTK